MKSKFFKTSKSALFLSGVIMIVVLSVLFFAFTPKKTHSIADCQLSMSYDVEVQTTKTVVGEAQELSPGDQAQVGDFFEKYSITNCIDQEGATHTQLNNIENDRAFASGAMDSHEMKFTDTEIYAKNEEGQMQSYAYADAQNELISIQRNENRQLVEALRNGSYSEYMLKTLEAQGYTKESEENGLEILTKSENNGVMKATVNPKTGQIVSTELVTTDGNSWKSTMSYEREDSFLPSTTITEEVTPSVSGVMFKTTTITKISNFQIEK
jgi:hypothetical protein